MVDDYDHNTRILRTFALNPEAPGEAPKLLWSRNRQDRYKDPGTPDKRMLSNGKFAVRQDGDSIFLASLGATPKGDRPFLHRFDLKTGATDQLFRCDDAHYELVEAILSHTGNNC